VDERKPVEFERSRQELAVRDAEDSLDELLGRVRSWLSTPGKLVAVQPTELRVALRRMAGTIEQLRSAPEEAIETRTRPMAATRHGLVCGSCGWCVGGCCTVDPPMTWKGENSYRFIRPEVCDDTPACSRWEKREDR
jgi:hypothetical protein